MKFDVINRLERYFDVMELPQEEKKKRVELGDDLFDAFYFVLSMMAIDKDIDKDFYVESLRGRVTDAFKDADVRYEEEYLNKMTEEIIDTTLRHLDEDYYFSEERALLIAENETNTSFNNYDYVTAKENGAAYKTWLTEGDEKVRTAHADVDFERIPIDDYFYVGGDRMRYPHDYLNGSPENLINCRCTCKYE